MIKRRWIYKTFTWKALSTIIGFFAVWITAHDLGVGLAYLAVFVPVSMVAFIAHEKVWHAIKVRNHCQHCDGVGMYMTSWGYPEICSRCEGTGDKRNSPEPLGGTDA